MSRTTVSSGSPMERIIGSSRAVRVGDLIWVAGTAPLSAEGETVSLNDAYGQTIQCIKIIQKAIEDIGGRIEHVVRTRLMLTNIADKEDVCRAHQQFFEGIRPVCTIVEVNGFTNPEWLIEVEADCIIQD